MNVQRTETNQTEDAVQAKHLLMTTAAAFETVTGAGMRHTMPRPSCLINIYSAQPAAEHSCSGVVPSYLHVTANAVSLIVCQHLDIVLISCQCFLNHVQSPTLSQAKCRCQGGITGQAHKALACIPHFSGTHRHRQTEPNNGLN